MWKWSDNKHCSSLTSLFPLCLWGAVGSRTSHGVGWRRTISPANSRCPNLPTAQFGSGESSVKAPGNPHKMQVFLTCVFSPFSPPTLYTRLRGMWSLTAVWFCVQCSRASCFFCNFISCFFFFFLFPESETCQQSSPLLYASSHRWRLSS